METSRIILGFIRASPKFLFKFQIEQVYKPTEGLSEADNFFGQIFFKVFTRMIFKAMHAQVFSSSNVHALNDGV